ncbi:XtrA/YqaO family protein [Cytobacillus oceanisediminis]|uniref:XtrA/YqaO family protein n=1 Tax=Cytobacillus oceanisediminis TaxID=665099 RepID=UPI001FB40A9A|nr:XtrA/YqaO family protein [Cytobacillus oceanisediminis]
MKRVNELHVNIDNMSIEQKLESGKIKIIVLDGQKGVVSSFEAVKHGETVIETVNGHAKRIHFRESELI